MVVHLVNFYFGSVFFRDHLVLYYLFSFFIMDVYLSSHFLYNLLYEKKYKLKHFLYKNGVRPWEYFLAKFFVDALLVTFQFITFFTEIVIFFRDYRIRTRNLIFLLIGLYLFKLQFLASSYVLSLLDLRLPHIHQKLCVSYFLSFVCVYLLVFFYAKLVGNVPYLLICLSEVSYISSLVYITTNDMYRSLDDFVMKVLPFQFVYLLLYLSFAIGYDCYRLSYNYRVSRKDLDGVQRQTTETQPKDTVPKDNSTSQDSKSGHMQVYLDSGSENSDSDKECYESEDEEQYLDRMIKYLRTLERFFLTTGQNAFLKVFGLKKSFGRKEVLDLTFGFQPGICLGLIGPNGAGKTTTINLLLSLIPKSQGVIQFQNEQPAENIDPSLTSSFRFPTDHSELSKTRGEKGSRNFWKEICGVCFQEESLWYELTVEQHVDFMCTIYNIENKEKVRSLLKYFEIYHLLKREIFKLSSGEKKKLTVVMNLIVRSRFYVFDEISANLDPDSREDLRKILNKLKIGYKATILTTTHFIKGHLASPE